MEHEQPPGRDVEIEARQQGLAVVGEAHVAQAQPARRRRHRLGRLRRLGRDLLEQLGDAHGPGPRRLPGVGDVAELLGELGEHLGEVQKDEEAPDGVPRPGDEAAGEEDLEGGEHGRQEPEQHVVAGQQPYPVQGHAVGQQCLLRHALALVVLPPERLHHADAAHGLVDGGGHFGAAVQRHP